MDWLHKSDGKTHIVADKQTNRQIFTLSSTNTNRQTDKQADN